MGAGFVDSDIDMVQLESTGVDSGERLRILLDLLAQPAHRVRVVDFDWEEIDIVVYEAE